MFGSEVTPYSSDSCFNDIWSSDQSFVKDVYSLDILLPYGILVPVDCPTDRTLSLLKTKLFVEAKKFPLHDRLQSQSDYIFYTITSSGEKEEFYDESRTIDSLKLFVTVLCLVEPEGNRKEKQLAHDIGIAIGHPLNELEHGLSKELETARLDLYRVVEESVRERRNKAADFDLYLFPEDLISDQLPESGSISSDCPIVLWFPDADCLSPGVQTTVHCNIDCTNPAELVHLAFESLSRSSPDRPFLLKVVGKRLYLTQPVPLSRFTVNKCPWESVCTYIRDCLETKTTPQLMLRCRQTVMKDMPGPWDLIQPSWIRARGGTHDSDSNLPPAVSLWAIDKMLTVRIKSASHINVTDVDFIYAKAAIYHGPDVLVNRNSKKVPPSNPRWAETWIDFQFYVPDIPPTAIICFSVVSIRKRKNLGQDHLPLGWANMNLLNWRGELVQGGHTLYLWPFPKDYSDNVYPMGPTESNPDHDTIRLEVEFVDFGQRVQFPSPRQIGQYVATLKKWEARRDNEHETAKTRRKEIFERIIATDPQELTDKEHEIVWQMRDHASNYPELLPRLLAAVQWGRREHVAQLYVLLQSWPLICPEIALELLDTNYPDRNVRSFAVRCLDATLCDDRLQLCLNSLVQTLKYETFCPCDLSVFILRRAFRNLQIGQLLFWLLRAELAQNHRLHKRFVLLLEAYARGVGPYLRSLLKQVIAVDRLSQLSVLMKQCKEKELATKELNSHLDVIQFFESPLNPSDVLGELKKDSCRVIGSAKLPMFLSWTNLEPLSSIVDPVHQIIFKNGDDLRQDFLILQVMKIMDSIWKAEGYNFCLDPYNCLPMGKNVYWIIGMIQVVKRSKTIFEIQNYGSRRAGPFIPPSSHFLNKWIRHHNNNPDKYSKAVDRFTRSCAGYCVATFVLGIKDRHQDNIMVTEDGRIFHIDFGHFLGHYKKKLGINRDRVPFVLTDNFIVVIAKGKSNFRDSDEFKKFQQLCGEAYVMLHKHAKLFISLFTMMLCMDIPELQKLDDVNYLRRTLAADMSDVDALAYFQDQLNDAYEGGWTTKTNWFFHSVRHGL